MTELLQHHPEGSGRERDGTTLEKATEVKEEGIRHEDQCSDWHGAQWTLCRSEFHLCG